MLWSSTIAALPVLPPTLRLAFLLVVLLGCDAPLLSIVTSSARIAARFLSAEKLRREAVCSYSDSWTTASLDVDGISLPGLHSLRY